MEKTVFVVMINGDRAVADSMAALIGSMGYAVRVYDSCEEFVSAYVPDQRGCVVIDLDLSDHKAVQLVEDLPTRGVALPIIMMAEYDPAAAAVSALPAGVIVLLQKPFMDELLADTIEQAFTR